MISCNVETPPELRNLDLNEWILPCRSLVGALESQKRQFPTVASAFSKYSSTDIFRTIAALQCVALSETLQLSLDVLIDSMR